MGKAGDGGDDEQRRQAHPIPTAEMNVPTNANVRMTPKLRKKFSYNHLSACLQSMTHLFELVARVENDRRQKEIEEEGMFEELRCR